MAETKGLIHKNKASRDKSRLSKKNCKISKIKKGAAIDDCCAFLFDLLFAMFLKQIAGTNTLCPSDHFLLSNHFRSIHYIVLLIAFLQTHELACIANFTRYG